MRKVISVLGYFWTAGPFAVVAVALLVLGGRGAAASTALAGAGAALAGVAAGLIIELARQRRADQREAADRRRRDLDETLRLGYMALMTIGHGSYEVAATVANALAHHQAAAQIDTALTHLKTLAEGAPAGDVEASKKWLMTQLLKIRAEFGDTSPIAVQAAAVVAGKFPG